MTLPKSGVYGTLVLILVLAVAVRLPGLNTSLWYDEIDTLVQFVRLPLADIFTTYTSTNNHLFYSLQAKLALSLFGESPWSLRLPAVIFGIASIALMWPIARSVVRREEALLVCLLLALSYHHVWFSQDARGYTGLLFWTLLSTGVLTGSIGKGDWRAWTIYGLAFAAAMYTHMSAALFLSAHGFIYAAFLLRRFAVRNAARTDEGRTAYLSTVRPFVGMAIGCVLTLILYAPLFSQILHALSSDLTPDAHEELSTLEHPFQTILAVIDELLELGPFMYVALPFSVLFVSIGALSVAKRNPVLAAVYLIHIPFSALMLAITGALAGPRFYFVDVCFLFLCLVRGAFVSADWLGSRAARRFQTAANLKLRHTVVVLALVGGALVLLPRVYIYPKQDFEGALAYIEANRRPDDAIASIGLASEVFESYYAPAWDVVKSVADLELLQANAKRVWLVVAFQDDAEAKHPDIFETQMQEFEQVETRPGTLGNGTIYIYRSREP